MVGISAPRYFGTIGPNVVLRHRLRPSHDFRALLLSTFCHRTLQRSSLPRTPASSCTLANRYTYSHLTYRAICPGPWHNDCCCSRSPRPFVGGTRGLHQMDTLGLFFIKMHKLSLGRQTLSQAPGDDAIAPDAVSCEPNLSKSPESANGWIQFRP